MARKQEILDEVHQVLAETLADELDVTVDAAYDHVRLAEYTDDGPVPAYTIESFETDVNRGLGSGVHVASSSRVADAVTVTLRRFKELTVDIAAFAAGDDARQVNDLYDAAEARFVRLTRDVPNTGTLHPDVERLDVAGVQDASAPQDNIRGDRLRVSIEYQRQFDETFLPMDNVDITLTTDPADSGDGGTDDNQYGNVSFSYDTRSNT